MKLPPLIAASLAMVSLGWATLQPEPAPEPRVEPVPPAEAAEPAEPSPEPAAQPVGPAAPQAIGLRELSRASKECVDCHRRESMGLYEQWGNSKHYRGNVGCYECHAAERTDVDAFEHYDHTIAVIVSPKDCAKCHSREVEEFAGSHHAKGGRILGSLDNVTVLVAWIERASTGP